MKKILLIVLAITLFSCANKDKESESISYVVINGDLKNSVAEEAVVRGYDYEQKIPVAIGGKFTDTLSIPQDGTYELYINRERTAIYLEKGKDLAVSLDANQFDETITYTGELAVENNYLAAKYLLSEKEKPFQEVYSMTEEDFVNEVNTINTSYKDLLMNTQNLPAAFAASQAKEIEYEHISNLENYQELHGYFTKDKSFKVSSNFYDAMKNINYKDTLAFRNSAAYREMLSTHYGRMVEDANDNSPDFNRTVAFLSIVDKNLPSGYAKDQLMSGHLKYGLRPDVKMDEAYAIYKNSSPNAENLEKITQRYNKLKPLLPGNDSPTFDYENHKGGTTSLADLNGKYVYVDVWATWCGPCIREIPSLKEVETDYHGKNIEFVSISIDVKKDYETWKTMVVEKDLGGIQLMADSDWKSEFVDNYGILGIPRFILIDPQGKIVSADAPRPSDPDLRTMLDELI